MTKLLFNAQVAAIIGYKKTTMFSWRKQGRYQWEKISEKKLP